MNTKDKKRFLEKHFKPSKLFLFLREERFHEKIMRHVEELIESEINEGKATLK